MRSSPATGGRHPGSAFAAVVALALACLSPHAAAQSEADVERGRQQFQLGNAAYQEGRYEQALEYFQQAQAIAPNDRLLLYIGQCYDILGDAAAALDYVTRYAESSPEARAEVADILESLQGTMQDSFAQARRGVTAALRLARSGTERRHTDALPRRDRSPDGTVIPVTVRSAPEGADVYIDTNELGPVGRTPLTTGVFAGPHVIIVDLPHHHVYEQRVDASPRRAPPVVDAELERRVARIEMRVHPSSARVTYVGPTGETRDMGQGGWSGELPAGPSVFLISHAGRQRRVERVLESESGETFTLYLDERLQEDEPRAELGLLRIRSDLPFATVTVDGGTVGTGRGSFETRVVPGRHVIRVCQEGYHCAVDSISLASAEEAVWTTPVRLEEVGSTPWGAIVTAGLSAAALVTGAIFLVDAADQRDQGLDDDADTSAIIGYVGLGVGAALAITSIVLFVNAGPEHEAEASASYRPSLWVDGGSMGRRWGVSLSGRW